MSTATLPLRSYSHEARKDQIQLARKGMLAICLALIGTISGTDIWFAVANSSIMMVEQNPICMALMELDPKGLSFFIFGKAAGTAVVILTLLLLHIRGYRHAKLVTAAVTFFQLGLFTYLTLSDPLTGNLPNFQLLFGNTPESIWRIG